MTMMMLADGCMSPDAIRSITIPATWAVFFIAVAAIIVAGIKWG